MTLMGANLPRIPRVVRLLGVCIKVRQIPPSLLKEYSKEDRALDGLWCDDQQTIYLNKKTSQGTKIHTFLHELQHALIDVRELFLP